MQRALVLILTLFAGCVPLRSQQRPVDSACYRQCEQIWWACKATCPKDLGGSLGCTIASCNPARNECLSTCPTAASHPAPESARTGLPMLGPGSKKAKVEALQQLRDGGKITDDQFEEERAKIILAPDFN